MIKEDKTTTEGQLEKISAIDGAEVLGYEGSGREEHSGQKAPRETDGLTDDLADNKPEQMPGAVKPPAS